MVPLLPEIEGAVVDVNFAPNATGHPKLYIHSTTIIFLSLKCLVLLRGVKTCKLLYCNCICVWLFFAIKACSIRWSREYVCAGQAMSQNGLQCQNKLPLASADYSIKQMLQLWNASELGNKIIGQTKDVKIGLCKHSCKQSCFDFIEFPSCWSSNIAMKRNVLASSRVVVCGL